MMQSSNILLMVLLVATTLVVVTQGFAPTPFLRSTTCTVSTSTTQRNGIFDKVGEFFEELDAFVDDATSRRLGNGSKFYGKRRSNFYGEQDQDRKRDRTVSDPTEDYQGPSSSGYFQWMPDENGQMRPVTRMKGKTMDNPGMWDKVYADKDD
mmetsp:Transcript_118272/g.331257  ORF Transcript_118272/g.331257 Transcript_118272/m.331257 type:complete len:152 (+) Transcript_118272:224-679(+)